MFQENVLVQERPAIALRINLDYRRTESQEILRVLERAAEDDAFIAQLTYHGSDALQGYSLSSEAKAALLSGDVGWIEAYVGELDRRLRTWPDCRLQQEIW
jgi:hypothetical protein